jgi:hypothetical protein
MLHFVQADRCHLKIKKLKNYTQRYFAPTYSGCPSGCNCSLVPGDISSCLVPFPSCLKKCFIDSLESLSTQLFRRGRVDCKTCKNNSDQESRRLPRDTAPKTTLYVVYLERRNTRHCLHKLNEMPSMILSKDDTISA